MKILFIGHDAQRAGAQILLLQFLQWVKANRPDIIFDIVLTGGGPLLNEYQQCGEVSVFVYNTKNKSLKSRIKRYIRKIIFIKRISKNRYDLIYSNTIVNGRILKLLKVIDVPIITHVHELDYWINQAGKENLDNVRASACRYIVPSEAVRSCLVNKYNFNDAIISTINEFIVYDKLGLAKQSIKSKLNIPSDAVIVGASGAESWRKGKDWFVPLAIDVLSRGSNKNIHFVWIGGEVSYELSDDLSKSGFEDNIHFVKHLPSANEYFHEFSVFAMLSREDPFPVVNLEAAGLGVPIVCFDKSGGTPELINEGCGFVVPYGNIHAFADKVSLLLENEKLSINISIRSKKIIQKKYDINIIANKMINNIENILIR